MKRVARRAPWSMAPTSSLNLKRAEDADKVFLIRQMNVILQMEGNFLASYDLVLEKVTDDAIVEPIRRFRGDHERHVLDVTAAIEEMGGVPFEAVGPSPAFEVELDMMRRAGGVDELLAYFEIGERQSVWLYDAARSLPGIPSEVNDVLERALQDENQHHAWAVARLGTVRAAPVDQGQR